MSYIIRCVHVCVPKYNLLSLSTVIHVSGLTNLYWITSWCTLSGEGCFFHSQYSLVTCSSLSGVETS